MNAKNIVILALGVIMLVMGGSLGFSRWQFLRNAIVSKGTVVAMPFGGAHPKIEFILKSNERVVYQQGGLIGGYKVGDRVDVLYLEKDPSGTACVDAVGAIWAVPIILSGIGLILLCSVFINIR